MKTEIVTITQARQRAKVLHASGYSAPTELALCAYDVVTDQFPENDVKLLGNARQALARGEFEFTIN